MTPWLSIVGMGEDGLDGVSPAGRLLIEQAETLVGAARHLAMAPQDHPAERLQWSSPLDATIAEILARRGRRVCVLATGDPMWYGIGATLAGVIDGAEMTIIPAPSAFSLACARLAWPLAETACFTLHGRPLDLLRLHLAPGARLVMLATDGDSPARIAALLRDTGYGMSSITVLERMGGADERRIDGAADGWDAPPGAALNTVAVECRTGADAAAVWSRAPGLPDTAYENDGQLTKRETRAATLAALMPLPGQRLWDVGAGCGSIAIEWLRAARGGAAIAIEREPARCAMIARNAACLGTPGLEIVDAAAPDALIGLASPDAVFIGGGVSLGLIETCWNALTSGGRLAANAVTIEGEAALTEARTAFGGDLTRIAISRAEPLGDLSGWRALAPVTQWSVIK